MSQILLPTEFELPTGRRVINQDGNLGVDSPYRDEWKAPDFWELRERLFSVSDTKSAAWFLNRCGYAVVIADESLSTGQIKGKDSRVMRSPVKPEDISDQLVQFLIRWGKIVREMMLLRTGRWHELQTRYGQDAEYFTRGTGRYHAVSSAFGWNDAGFPSIKVFVHDALEVIVVTVHIDKLRKIHFRECKRQDCGKVFARLSKHRKVFCSPECAHLVVVRNSRKPARQKSGPRARRFKKGE